MQARLELREKKGLIAELGKVYDDQSKLTEVLGHRIRFQCERVEFVGIDGELLLDRSQSFVVNKE